MKNVLITLIVLFYAISTIQSQNCTDCRYLTEIFDSVEVIEDVKFAEGENSEGNMQELFMDIYLPVGDTFTKRPVLLFAFGGAFLTGDKRERYVKFACERYAKAGYVAAAMDYRIGIDFVGGISNPGNEAIRVFFRAMQDLRASVEYFYYTAQNGNTYQVDTSLIFLGGASAGAISALFTEYCDSPQKMAEIGDTAVLDDFGGFEASSSIYPGYSRKVAGILNVAGALTNADWVKAGKAPHISAHGDEDETVPYEDDNQLNSGLGLLGINLEGSYLIDQAANNKGMCSYLYTIVGGDHPSGSAPPSYYNAIFNRWMPRMYSIIRGKTFCCNGTVDIQGDTAINDTSNLIALEMQHSNLSNPDFKWCTFPCDTSSAQASFQVEAEEGAYFIAVASDNNCLATDFVQISKDSLQEPTDTTSVFVNNHSPNDVHLYPNPVEDQLLIDLPEGSEEIQVMDLNGRLIAKETVHHLERVKLNVSDFPKGSYLIWINAGVDQYKSRFLKQ